MSQKPNKENVFNNNFVVLAALTIDLFLINYSYSVSTQIVIYVVIFRFVGIFFDIEEGDLRAGVACLRFTLIFKALIDQRHHIWPLIGETRTYNGRPRDTLFPYRKRCGRN